MALENQVEELFFSVLIACGIEFSVLRNIACFESLIDVINFRLFWKKIIGRRIIDGFGIEIEIENI